MAKKSSVEKNKRRARMAASLGPKRAKLKAIMMDRDLPFEERLIAQAKMSELPRNSARVRYRNRCEFSGRPRGVYRKFKLSRIALRDFGSFGQIPGLVKSSW